MSVLVERAPVTVVLAGSCSSFCASGSISQGMELRGVSSGSFGLPGAPCWTLQSLVQATTLDTLIRSCVQC